MFINVGREFYDTQISKWDSKGSSRILFSDKAKGIKVYCINTYDRTTYVAEQDSNLSINDLFDWYEAMDSIRRNSEKVSV